MLNEIRLLSCQVSAFLQTPCECGEYITEVTAPYATTCVASDITLTADTSGKVTAYQWQIYSAGNWVNASGTSTEKEYTILDLIEGVYEYRVVVIDCHGCESQSESFTLTVVPNTLQIYISADDNEFCSMGTTTIHSEVLFNAINIDFNPNLSVQWQSSSDGITYTDIPGASNPTYTTEPLGYYGNIVPYGGYPYFYRAVATYNGCVSDTGPTGTNSDQTIVIVTQLFFDYWAAEDDTICDGGIAILHGSTLGGSGSSTFQWQELINDVWVDIPGANGSDLATDSLTTGIYNYRLEVIQDSGCYGASLPIQVTVVPDPVVTITADDETISAGGSFTLSSNVTGGNGTSTYQWQLFDLNATGWTNSDIFAANASTFTNIGSTVPDFDPIIAGSYLLRVVVIQDSGCEAFSNEITITVT